VIAKTRLLETKQSNGCTVINIVAEKPVTFKSIRTILRWFQNQVERAVNPKRRKEGMALSCRYFKRLGLSQDRIDQSPTLAMLQAICEAHLENIPFENLSQHGLSEPASVNVDQIANKILGRHRGGFCFELNGLLAELLTELGYKLVRVIAHVYKNGGYIEDATHLFLMVTVADPKRNNEEAKFLVDVGMGEPPIHPLRYDFDAPQCTPEGMVSRFVKIGGDVALEWLDIQSGNFVPRYKFKAEDASIEGAGPAFGDFAENLKKVHYPDSIFEQKLVVCSLTRSQKKTLAGNRLKITGPPRFDKDVFPSVKELGDVDDVRAVLMSEFGIPLDETDELQLTKSLKSSPELWTNL
jgi:N-hydroxyarylamine O-acetyltransferase